MSSSYNTPRIKHKLVVSIYSNTERSLAMSTLAIWCRIVQSRDVSLHNFDGLAMSGLAFSVAPHTIDQDCYAHKCDGHFKNTVFSETRMPILCRKCNCLRSKLIF